MRKTALLLCIIMLFSGCAKEQAPTETMPATEVLATEAPTETPTEPPEPPEPEEQRTSFLACGDNMIFYGNVRDAASLPGERTYNFAPTYENVRDIIASADISMINQETLMSGKHGFSYYPDFNGPQDMGLDLVDIGFDVICIANNHMMDKDEAGLLSTIEFWEGQPVTLIGGHKTEEDYNNIRIVEKNGIKVAFLAYTYGTNRYSLPYGSQLTIPFFNEETVKEQVGRAKEIADCVIVSAHWGTEYTFIPNETQKKYARIMTEAGADAIIGHHPHVIQPIEWLTASDGSKTLCVYSLGNFVSEQDHDYSMLGGMISFDIVKCGDSLILEGPLFTPTVYYFDSGFYNNRVYLLSQFTDQLAQSHGLSYYGNSITVEGVKKYLFDTIDKEFLAK